MMLLHLFSSLSENHSLFFHTRFISENLYKFLPYFSKLLVNITKHVNATSKKKVSIPIYGSYGSKNIIVYVNKKQKLICFSLKTLFSYFLSCFPINSIGNFNLPTFAIFYIFNTTLRNYISSNFS